MNCFDIHVQFFFFEFCLMWWLYYQHVVICPLPMWWCDERAQIALYHIANVFTAPLISFDLIFSLFFFFIVWKSLNCHSYVLLRRMLGFSLRCLQMRMLDTSYILFALCRAIYCWNDDDDRRLCHPNWVENNRITNN